MIKLELKSSTTNAESPAAEPAQGTTASSAAVAEEHFCVAVASDCQTFTVTLTALPLIAIPFEASCAALSICPQVRLPTTL